MTSATGISVNAFANIAGVNWGTIGAIMDGSREQVRTSSAKAILAVTTSTVESTATDARVDSTGSIRRLRALAVKGWSLAQVEARFGISYDVLQSVRDGRKPLIAAKTRRRIAAAYSELADKEPPEMTRGEKISARKARAATQPDWAPPGAWDESFIDDPAAEPRWDWVRRPERRKRRYGATAELTEDLQDLMRLGGLSRELAATQLGITDKYAEKLLIRARQEAEREEATGCQQMSA